MQYKDKITCCVNSATKKSDVKTVQNEAHFNYIIKNRYYSDIASFPVTVPSMKKKNSGMVNLKITY